MLLRLGLLLACTAAVHHLVGHCKCGASQQLGGCVAAVQLQPLSSPDAAAVVSTFNVR